MAGQLYIDTSPPYEYGDLPYATLALEDITPPELPVTEGNALKFSLTLLLKKTLTFGTRCCSDIQNTNPESESCIINLKLIAVF